MQNINIMYDDFTYEKENKFYYYLLLILNIYGIIYTFVRSVSDVSGVREEVFISPLEFIILHSIMIIGVLFVNSKFKDCAISNKIYTVLSILTYLIFYIVLDNTASIILLSLFIILNTIALEKLNVIILGSISIIQDIYEIVLSVSRGIDSVLLVQYVNRIFLITFIVLFILKVIDIFKNYRKNIITHIDNIKLTERVLTEYDNRFANIGEELEDNNKKIFELAYYDKLTGLPNRESFFKNLEDICVDDSDSRYILLIDIDNFKNINDFYSHDIGDKTILYITDTLKSICFYDSIIARVGGDIFAIILDNKLDYKEVVLKIEKALNNSLSIGQYEINISVSTGVARFPEDGSDSSELFKNTELAMFKAKELGKGQSVKYTPKLGEALLKKIDLIEKMKKSLANNEVHLVYQPIFDALTNELKGFEALVRWKNKDLGYISPLVFIELAEETGYIVELSDWIFREAAIFAKRINQGNKKTYVSVNLSGVLLQYDDLYTYITGILEELQVEPNILNLEITETSIVEHFDSAVSNLLKLKDLGMKISLDDFGTGYSSLTYLRRLPINTLKIDKTFIDEVLIDTKSAIMINEVINLASLLELETVAEGVETKEQLDFLAAKKCGLIQGYYLSRPLVEKDALEIFEKHAG